MVRFGLTCGVPPGTIASGALIRLANRGLVDPVDATLYACALGAPPSATCADLAECMGGKGQAQLSPQCDGEILRVAAIRRGADPEPAAVSCRALGGASCYRSASNSFCGYGECAPGETYSCDGDMLVGCMQGIRTRRPCGVGATCGVTAGSHVVDCVGKGKPCTGGGRCEGDTLFACLQDGFGAGLEQAIPCADYGLTCASGKPSVGPAQAFCAFRAESSGCADDSAAQCEGDRVRVCVNRSWVLLSCGELGLTGKCATTTGGPGASCK